MDATSAPPISVLLVEDDDELAALLGEYFERHGTEDLGAVAAAADPGTLVLTQRVPAVPDAQGQNLFVDPIRAAFGGEIVFAADGDRYTLEPR